ncbi:MAG TPA: hypothetical protein VHE30_27230 [Polyangiaceae bacterium]|nr:hypothetical protein [Polyangiaceae bacterium]
MLFAVVGAASGVILGALAGSPGMLVGGAVGAAIGALASLPFGGKAAADAAHDGKLDRDLGISEGDVGAPNLPHLPARIAAPSAAAAGASTGAGTDGTPAEGPMPPSE